MAGFPRRSKNQCPICLGWISVPLFTKKGFEHRKCNECSSIFVEPFSKIDVEKYGANYQQGYDTESSYQASAEWAKQILAGLGRIYGVGQSMRSVRVIEVGCSTGHLLDALKHHVVDTNSNLMLRLFGIDISEYGIQQCVNHGFHNTHVSCFPDIERLVVGGRLRLPFDAVVLTHLLEHIPEVQEAWDVLSLIARSVFIHMPCADLEKGEDWIHFNPRTIGEHCVFYSKFGLKLMLQGHGFEIVDEGTTVDDQWIWAISRRYGLTKELWESDATFI